MELLYILIGFVIGLGIGLFLDVDSFSKKVEEKEKEFDAKIEHPTKEPK